MNRCSKNTSDHRVCILAVPHFSIDKNEFRKCDQYAVGIILFPHGDIVHETEWDHPLSVESYIIYSLDIFLILFATDSLYTYWLAP